MIGVTYGMKAMAANGSYAGALLPFLVGVLLGLAFLHRQRNLSRPLVDLSLFADRGFRAALTLLSSGYSPSPR